MFSNNEIFRLPVYILIKKPKNDNLLRDVNKHFRAIKTQRMCNR